MQNNKSQNQVSQSTSLTNELNDNHMIVFMDGSVKEITKKQYDFIVQSAHNGQKMIMLEDGFTATLSNVSKIVSLAEYYKLYPDKRPMSYDDGFDRYKQSAVDKHYNKERPLKLIMKGFKKEVETNMGGWQDNPLAKHMYEQMEKKLKTT